ncbi:rhodanese-like domain-containing protein [Paraclostridium benzoelyticum]|uniref:rhodanese-like domain-containing protein n=1 Tax=Paraclostridium benzoelyticum TaxID=1629550 RepID=UPI0031CD0166
MGIEGVEKRIDVLATAIKANLTVFDLQDVETCYAPPYNSAKDPVNMLGYYASNIIEGDVETIQYHEVDEVLDRGDIVLDVRDEFELATGMIEGSVNIPLGSLRKRIDELPKDKNIYVTCQVGLRGYIACRILTQRGYKCFNIDGGIKTYTAVKRAKKSIENQSQNVNSTLKTKIKNEEGSEMNENIKANIVLDACGLQCPGPIRRVLKKFQRWKVEI